MTWRLKAGIWPSARQHFTKHIPAVTQATTEPRLLLILLLLLKWLYSPCGPSPLFQFPDLFYSQSAGLLEWVISSSRLYIYIYNSAIKSLCTLVYSKPTIIIIIIIIKFLVFADDLKIFRIIDNPHDCLLLQNDIQSESRDNKTEQKNYKTLWFLSRPRGNYKRSWFVLSEGVETRERFREE
jgi:hypothetical protein